ncbi:hypothetical protein IQ230_19855 [Gloeocapsopsis crepidinum LEGE 06123]|uniref:Uncharacterized protein n=1 Tax=Gloeocapsopsis crepidinum LEGE 06123 TaxID=588587 RepID=A0ABR9UZA6_9CHRO|nr:hypothetical protein [Gloeocapsopsis crepidinum]MBE9192563.1 hypothetical protein [Gloeocapsopsis crepidinum LEGE 06123]
MLEEIEAKVAKMPPPQLIQVPPKSRLALTLHESYPQGLTITWQWTLAKVSEALVARNTAEILELLFIQLDYTQLIGNAVEDVRSLVRQPADENLLIKIEAKLDSFKKLMGEYLKQPQTHTLQSNDLLDEFNYIIQELQSLDVVGVGAFMLASGSYLALLQEQASLGEIEWSCVKKQAIKYSQYAASVTPKLFRLTVGQIDKACYCINWEAESQERSMQYECHYFDGKDMHLFLAISPNAEMECNKHRLLMFQSVTDKVNQTAVKPVRTALKQWQKMAASL